MKQTLQGLQPRRQFCERLDSILEANISPYDFHAPGMQWLKDAIIARQFAELTSAAGVGLIAEKRPDFEVQYRNGKILRFEATRADIAGRRMAKEHKEQWHSGVTVQSLPEDILEVRRRAIPGALEAAARRKARKSTLYSAETNLLIDLNLPTHGYDDEVIGGELIEFTQHARQLFNSIWVLWSGRLFRTWPEPFNGGGEFFRPEYHELGWAIRTRSSHQRLDEIFLK